MDLFSQKKLNTGRLLDESTFLLSHALINKAITPALGPLATPPSIRSKFLALEISVLKKA